MFYETISLYQYTNILQLVDKRIKYTQLKYLTMRFQKSSKIHVTNLQDKMNRNIRGTSKVRLRVKKVLRPNDFQA